MTSVAAPKLSSTGVRPRPSADGSLAIAMQVVLFPLLAWMIVNASWMSRLPVVDGAVQWCAGWLIRIMDALGLAGGIDRPLTEGCFVFPVVELSEPPSELLGDGASSLAIASHWLRYPFVDFYGWAVVLLAVYGVLVALIVRAAAYPRAKWGRPQPRSPALWRESLRIAVVSSPILFLCVGAYWPLVNLWGSAAFRSVDELVKWPWIVDAPWTRGVIATALGLVALWCSLILGVRGIGRYRIRQDPHACAACNYDLRHIRGLCPECGVGSAVHLKRLRVCLWAIPWCKPTRARRTLLACAFSVLIVAMLAAPLVVGVFSALI